MAKESSCKFSGSIGSGDFVGDAVVKVVGTLAALIGRPRGAKVNVLLLIDNLLCLGRQSVNGQKNARI